MSTDDKRADDAGPEETAGEASGKGRRRAEIHRDDIKEMHTSHWDVDVLDRETLERLYAENRRRRKWRAWLTLAAGVAGLLLVVGCGLLWWKLQAG